MEFSTQFAQNMERFKPHTKTVIRFEDGIYGFESIKDYILIQEEKHAVIWSLQAACSAYPSLFVVSPFLVDRNYDPVVSEDDFEKLGRPAEEDLCVLAVAVIKRDWKQSVVNLKSPILINAGQKIGRQIILEDTEYSIRSPLFSGPAGLQKQH